jgi:hypothetical protein
VGSSFRVPSAAYVKGEGVIANPLPIENPNTMATNTFGVYFTSPCPICGLFFACNKLMLTLCGCTHHPFCFSVHVGGKDSRKCASQTCGENFLEKWFNSWGVKQINLQLKRPKIEKDDKCITSAITSTREACLPSTDCKHEFTSLNLNPKFVFFNL